MSASSILEHPIVTSVTLFTIEDELFQFRNLQPDNHVLLTAASGDAVRPIAWTRRVETGVCFISPWATTTRQPKTRCFKSWWSMD